jgi:acetyl-CoA synthetase
MTGDTVVPVTAQWARQALVDAEGYRSMYAESIADPDGFWAAQAEQFSWHKKWRQVRNSSFHSPVTVEWFKGAKLNITENCLDRHLPARANQIAYIWEKDEPGEAVSITYGELHEQVCRFANVLKSKGVNKGDTVTIYMPMIPEAIVAMLGCARLGAVHSVVFAGFSVEALRGRIEGCASRLVVTADEGLRGGKKIPLKANVDGAVRDMPGVQVVVVKRTGGGVAWKAGRDSWYHEEMAGASAQCRAESMDANDPLFILYTSGSTGKPKGIVHGIAGYMVWVSVTHRYTFDYREGDVYWCTADVGWVTGHSYIVYGPLLNGAISVLYEGVPNYPDCGRFWQVVDTHRVTTLYTAPTAIRSLMREGDAAVQASSRRSLRLLGSVGEPINPEAWNWYWRVVGEGRCPIVDTWWQTETGGIMITPLPGATDLKPGSATLPFFGVQPVVVDEKGAVLDGACEGMLCIADSWPGLAQTIYGDHARFEQIYFSAFPGLYFSGDGAKRDADGYYWITGRVDDVLNVSGHRLGTAEIESALVAHPHVAEAAAVGVPHAIKGQGIYVYVTLNSGVEGDEVLRREMIRWVRQAISPIATPDHVHFTPQLPKTRSGKIMRRILRKIAEGEFSSLGDISTLTNPEIVDDLIRDRRT